MDKVTTAVRSRNMSLIRAKNTKPELLVRRALFKLGLRYRIHSPLPGKPDIVFTSQKLAIFIHGCFWHNHGCKFDHVPKSNEVFWSSKILKNKERDLKNTTALEEKGWRTLIIWECDILTQADKTLAVILKILNKPRNI